MGKAESPFGKLTKQQEDNAYLISKTAQEMGLDPDLALAIGWAESRFKGGVSPAGARGLLQVMPENAPRLGLSIEDLDDPSKNVRAGLTILQQNLDRFKGNEILAIAGYNTRWKTSEKFAKTLNPDDLPDETKAYLDQIDSFRPLQIAPARELTSEGGAQVPAEAAADSLLPEVKKDLPTSLTEDIPEPPPIDPKSGALVGSGAGVTAGAAETGKNLLSRRRAAAAEPAKAPVSGSPGQKWSVKTGYGRGEGETVREVSEAFQRAKNKGKVSGRIPVGGTLNIHEWARQKEMAEELARRSALKEVPGQVSRALGKIPLGSTLAGAGAGLDVAETAQRLKSGDIGGAGISGISALGQAATLIPHPVPRLGGALTALATMPADYIYQMMRENKKRKEKGLPPITTIPEEIEYDPMGNPIR